MKTKTSQLLIIAAVIAAAFVGAYVYATEHIAGLTKETAALRENIVNQQITYQHAENLQKAIQSAADQKVKIAGYFLPAGGAIDFISTLEQTAGSFGLTYNTQSISEESTDELAPQNKELLHVTFSARGSWSKVMRLLKAIESLPYGLRVDKVDLDTSADSSVPVTDASSTVAVKTGRMWTATILFSVVKTKDNAK